MPTFGEVIREKGLPQRQMAQELGISATSIPIWMYDHAPRPAIRDRIERYFGVDGIVFAADIKEEKKKSAPKKGSMRFVDLMETKGISIDQMAQDTGFSTTSISSWRRFRSPTNRSRKIIEDYLRVTGVIFGGDEAADVKKGVESKKGSLRFADLIAARGLSIAEVAEATGFSASGIRNWVKFKNPSDESRKIVEDYLKVTGVIFGGDEAVEVKTKHQEQVVTKVDESPLPTKEKTSSSMAFTLSASQEYVLMSVIKTIGFDEALRRLVN